MKHFTFPLLVLSCLAACQDVNSSKQQVETTQAMARLIVIADRSGSFVKSVQEPTPELFKPLIEKITAHGAALDFRFGSIGADSHVELTRYLAPAANNETPEQSNPWLQGAEESNSTKPLPDSDWDVFARAVSQKLRQPPAQASDVASALHHAVLSFQESEGATSLEISSPNSEGAKAAVPSAPTAPRKILLVLSDFKDTYHKELPHIPSDVEVIAVGVLSGSSLESKLGVKVRHFESLTAAIEFIASTF
jgi:hypothetical protein